MDDLNKNLLDLKMNFVASSYTTAHPQLLGPNITSGTTLPTPYLSQAGYGAPAYSPNATGCSASSASSQTNYALQQWSHQVPTVMPWSNSPQSLTTCNIFQFTSSPNSIQYGTPQFTSPFSTFYPSSSNLTTTATPSLIQTTTPNHFMPHNSTDMNVPFSNSSTEPCTSIGIPESFKLTDKRNFAEYCEDTDYEFDFDRSRPIKKYICDDKVLEIFDRLHIREGEQYIVEDVIDENTSRSNFNRENGPVIEELSETADIPVTEIELAPELRETLKKTPSSITDKLIQAERDRYSKAIVVWQQNPLLDLLTSSSNENGKNDTEIQIEEVFSDDEEMMEESILSNGVIIEPYYQEIVDQIME